MATHPYTQLWDTRDLAQWAEALSGDVTMHSPMFKKPFRGRDRAIEVFDVLLQTLRDFEVTHEFSGTQTHAFFWTATGAAGIIEGADLIRHDANDKIVEITVLIRPLVGIGAFAAVAGPPLARRSGRAKGWVASVIAKPLRVLLGIVDAVATRLVDRSG